MSISSEILRISGNVSDALVAIESKGVAVPTDANSDDLATLIAAIPSGGGSGGIVITDTTDSHGGTIRTITATEISGSSDITQNGTYNVASLASVTVNVSGGGGSTGSNDVVFYDYDGTIVDSYSAADFASLPALPANPSHTGLTAQGWNWSLADAKTHVAKYGSLNIGQMYTTSDGKTRIYIYIDPSSPANRRSFSVRFTSSVANNVTIDWGDGATETQGSTTATDYPHTYSGTGEFIITLTVNSGTISFVGTGSSVTSGYSIYGNRNNSNAFSRGRIRRIEIGDNVTGIGQSCFWNCYSLTNITIPDTVTSVGSYAFDSCFSLTSITMPDAVTSILNNTFEYCYSLTIITIPDDVTSIGASAFYNCNSLTSITIPDDVTSIGSSAFYNCNSLTTITIPDTATIDVSAFYGCDSITSITIPDAVTSIGTYTFYNCHSLASVTIPDDVTSIGTYAFYDCYSLTSITIPDTVTSILTSAFSYCYSLTSITIPDTVTSIGSNAFYNCYGLGEIHFLPTTPPTVSSSNAWTNIPTTCTIYVPTGSLSAYTTATNYPSSATYTYVEE